MTHSKQNKLMFYIFGICVCAVLFQFTAVSAHTPHDIIETLEISPNFAQDKTLFIRVDDQLKRSNDKGHTWKNLVNGLDLIYPISSIAISPSYKQDKAVYLSSKGDGIYRSTDQGDSWIKVNSGLNNLNVNFVHFVSSAAKQILLATCSDGSVYKTVDGGRHWDQILNKIGFSAIASLPDLFGNFIIAGTSTGSLYLSEDGGETWNQIYSNPTWGKINALSISSGFRKDNTFFIGTEKMGIFKTVDAGDSFIPLKKGMTHDMHIRSLAISPEFLIDKTIFATTWYEAAYRSTDAGENWVKYATGLSTNKQADTKKYKSPHYGDLRISNSFAKDKTIFLGGFDGLFKSTDAGKNWEQMETLPVRLIKGMALSSSGDDHLSVAITTYGGGVYLTENHGKFWRICNQGLSKTRVSDIVFSPTYRSDSTIFSGIQGYLLKSATNGSYWNKIRIDSGGWQKRSDRILKRLGFSKSFRKKIFPRVRKGVPYPSALVISPFFDSDRTIFFGTRWHGIFKSVNGGRTNSHVFDSMGAPVMSLAISPDFVHDATLFAAVRNKGIWKTSNGGEFWFAVNSGLNFLDSWKQLADEHQGSNKDIILKISPNYKKDKTVYAACSEGLYKTTDKGKKWQIIKNNLLSDESYITSIALSPDHEKDKTIIISLKGKGLFKSVDGGNTFTKIALQLINDNYLLKWIEFSKFYSKDKTIFAASDEELFRSTDRGNTWQIIKRPIRYENHRDAFRYEGPWKIGVNTDYSAEKVSFSNTKNAKMILFFSGTGIDWIGSKANDQGIAKIYINDKHVANVDQYSENREINKKIFSIRELPFGSYKITIEVSGMKNSASAGYRIEIDALDVMP